MGEKRRQFTLEFKLEAVRLTNDSDKPVSQIARELGIRPEMLRSWKRQAESRAGVKGTDVFPGHGKLTRIINTEAKRLSHTLISSITTSPQLTALAQTPLLINVSSG